MKYVIDLPDGEQVIFMRKKGMNIIVPKDSEMVVFDDGNPLGGVVKLTPYDTQIDRAQNEVWDLAKIIMDDEDKDGMSMDDIEECFGGHGLIDVSKLSYKEAREKYDAWKKKKGEIKVGDELAHNDDEEETVIVTRVLKESEAFDGFGKNGEVLKGYFYRFWHKTGRHFEKVAELLEELKMKGD